MLCNVKTVLAGLDNWSDVKAADRTRRLILDLYDKSRELEILKAATRAYLAAAANPLAGSPKITHDVVEED